MNAFISKFIKSSLLSSICLIILGILMFFQSELTIVSISYVIGALLIAIGVIAVLKFVNNMNKESKNELDIVYGIVAVILGIVVISNPKAVASIIPFVLGVLIVICSAAKLQYSLELRKKQNKLWESTMIISIITLLFGILLVFNPFAGAEFISKIIGVLLFSYGILDVISTLRIRKTLKEVKNQLESKVTEAHVIEENTSEEKDDDKKGEE